MITLDNIYDDLTTLLTGLTVYNRTGNYALGTKALIINSATLRGKEEEWGAQFRDPTITDGKIHALLFTKGDDAPKGRERDMRRAQVPPTVIYIALWHYKREGSASSNSDRDFNNEADSIVRALSAARGDLPASLKSLAPFRMRRDSKQLGPEDVHFAVGTLTVAAC